MRPALGRALLGFSLSLAPAVSVPAALLGDRLRRRRDGRRPRPGRGRTVAVTLALAAWLAGDLVRADPTALAASAWAALPVLVAAAVADGRWRGVARDSGLGAGVVAGLAIVAAVAWLEVLADPWGSASPGRAAAWFHHPNTLAAAAIAAATLLAAEGERDGTARRGATPWAVAAWAAAGLVVLATGSRAALGAWALLGIVLAADAVVRLGARAVVLPAALALAAVVAIVAGTGWADRFLPVRAPAAGAAGNLIAASEDLGKGPWRSLGVEVRESWSTRLLARTPAAFVVRKVEPAWWSRSQQIVPLPPNASLTLTFEARAAAPVEPGVHGLVAGGGELTVVRGTTAWRVRATGPLTAAEVIVMPVGGGWERVEVTFDHDAPEGGALAFGPLGDARAGVADGEAGYRRLMLVEGPATSYLPTAFRSVDARTSLGSWDDRLAYLRLAWHGFLERPWVGHGPDAFTAAATTALGYPARHAHNAVAAVAYERGLLGMLALATAALAFWRSTAPRRLRWTWTVVLIALGALDATWFASGAVALAAWHALGRSGAERAAVESAA